VNARVYDTQGRGVRVLASGAWVEGGPHSLTWDGSRDDGAEAAPGFYFLHLRVEGRDYRRGVVKLE
jgi:flagellar hook assembly protein FlgD